MLLFLQPIDGYGYQKHCSDAPEILVLSDTNNRTQVICAGASAALEFLERFGLKPKQQITIEIVTEPIIAYGYDAYGSYNRAEELITLMSYQSIQSTSREPQMYDQPFDLEHYRGAIAHEVAHAVFHHNSSNVKDQLTNATQEYLAHATQLAVLSEERRRKIINDHDVGPWESGDLISEVYMGLDPTGFAVKSYQHLTTTDNPREFITIILNHNWFYVSVP